MEIIYKYLEKRTIKLIAIIVTIAFLVCVGLTVYLYINKNNNKEINFKSVKCTITSIEQHEEKIGNTRSYSYTVSAKYNNKKYKIKSVTSREYLDYKLVEGTNEEVEVYLYKNKLYASTDSSTIIALRSKIYFAFLWITIGMIFFTAFWWEIFKKADNYIEKQDDTREAIRDKTVNELEVINEEQKDLIIKVIQRGAIEGILRNLLIPLIGFICSLIFCIFDQQGKQSFIIVGGVTVVALISVAENIFIYFQKLRECRIFSKNELVWDEVENSKLERSHCLISLDTYLSKRRKTLKFVTYKYWGKKRKRYTMWGRNMYDNRDFRLILFITKEDKPCIYPYPWMYFNYYFR